MNHRRHDVCVALALMLLFSTLATDCAMVNALGELLTDVYEISHQEVTENTEEVAVSVDASLAVESEDSYALFCVEDGVKTKVQVAPIKDRKDTSQENDSSAEQEKSNAMDEVRGIEADSASILGASNMAAVLYLSCIEIFDEETMVAYLMAM